MEFEKFGIILLLEKRILIGYVEAIDKKTAAEMLGLNATDDDSIFSTVNGDKILLEELLGITDAPEFIAAVNAIKNKS